MILGVPKETAAGERRVALVPDVVAKLAGAGLEVHVERGAGEAAFFSDAAYEGAGARLLADSKSLFADAETILKVQGPQATDDVESLARGSTLIGLLQPLTRPEVAGALATRDILSFSLDAVPRIARAQAMDALSSMSSLAGYEAAIIAARALPRFFPLMMTAAGTMPPAKGLVLGAGVAGLQAIATARKLGAVMQAFDVRLAAKEDVESLGATFVAVDEASHEDAAGYATELTAEKQQRELELIDRHAREADFIICTALIPGRPAPILITEEMVRAMRPGSVIVDLAAEMGGNCQLTSPGKEVVCNDVTILGPLNLPSQVPVHASLMYSRNISSLLLLMVKEGRLEPNFEDPILQGCCITRDGQVVHAATRALLQ